MRSRRRSKRSPRAARASSRRTRAAPPSRRSCRQSSRVSTSRVPRRSSRGACARSRRSRAPRPSSAVSGFASSRRTRSPTQRAASPARPRPARAGSASRPQTAGSCSNVCSARAAGRSAPRSSSAASRCPRARASRSRPRAEAPMPRPTERPRRGAARPPLGLAGRRRAAPTQARLVAARVLERVERARAFADLTLQAAFSRSELGARDRAFATELVYGTLRWRGRLDHLLRQVLDRDLAALEPGVLTLLRLGAYQLLFCDGVPASAAVDQTVRSARALGAERATGLVNAVLRRLAQQAPSLALPSLADDPASHLEHALGLPGWIAARWLAALGPAEAAALAEASNAAPPVTVRANRARISRDALLARLRPRFPEARACAHAPDGIVLGHGGPPAADPDFVDGLFSVQDEASQLVVELLAPARGERILDACAAPGTKTTALAERVGSEGLVVALDRSPRRLALIGRATRRLGLDNVTALERDATQSLADLPGAPFDRVLVDAPCTGLGALRRNADARWRVAPDDPARLAETQAALLASASACLRPGGTLVYSTCTLASEENDDVVAAFLARVPGFRRAAGASLPERLRPLIDAEGALRTWPHRHGMDGFFAARLERAT